MIVNRRGRGKRGKGKRITQAEKLLLLLINAKGREVSPEEIKHVLGGVLPLYRISAYFWIIKMAGAQIKQKKEGTKILSYQLTNHDEMYQYGLRRGFIVPPPKKLRPEDFIISS